MDDIVIKKLDLTGLNNVFWGVILIFLDFRINGFDILPDFIGFIVILFGLSKLSELSLNFQKAKVYGVISLFLSFLDVYQINYNVNSVPSWFWSYSLIVGLITMISSVLLYYYIINGIIEIASLCDDNAVTSSKGKKLFTWVFIARIIIYFTIPLTLFLKDNSLIVVIFAIVLSLIVEICFLIYIKTSYNNFNNTEVEVIGDLPKENSKKPLIIMIGVISCIIGVILSAYFYIDYKYIFTPLNYPTILNEKIGIGFNAFPETTTIDCTIWYDGTDKAYTPLSVNDNARVTKELLILLSDIIKNSPTWSDSFFKDDEAVLGDEYRTVIIYIRSSYIPLKIDINEKRYLVRLNEVIYQLNEDDLQKVLSFVSAEFPTLIRD